MICSKTAKNHNVLGHVIITLTRELDSTECIISIDFSKENGRIFFDCEKRFGYAYVLDDNREPHSDELAPGEALAEIVAINEWFAERGYN